MGKTITFQKLKRMFMQVRRHQKLEDTTLYNGSDLSRRILDENGNFKHNYAKFICKSDSSIDLNQILKDNLVKFCGGNHGE